MGIRKVKMRDGRETSVMVLGENTSTYKKYVVLVHGIGGNHVAWMPFAIPFMLNYTFIIPNLRGFGLSKEVPFNKPDDVITNYAEDLEDTIDQIVPEGEKVFLAGLSMGAYTCLKFIDMTKGKRVDKYLNIDQAPKAINSGGWSYGVLGHRQKYLFPRMISVMKDCESYLGLEFSQLPDRLRYEYIDALSDFFETAFHRPVERFAIKSLIRFNLDPVLEFFCANSFQSYYYCLKSYVDRDYDFRDVIGKYDFPVYVHIGKNSEMYPADGQRHIANTAKNLVQLVEFDEGHALMYTAPFKFYSAFKEFLHR